MKQRHIQEMRKKLKDKFKDVANATRKTFFGSNTSLNEAIYSNPLC